VCFDFYGKVTVLLDQNTKAFFWVPPLAAMPRFVAQTATAEVMSGADCAYVLPGESFAPAHMML
jgi:hypothetical protein